MNEEPFSLDALLQEAEQVADSGNKAEARQLVGEILRLNDKHVGAWTLLHKLAANTKEEIFCLKRIIRIDPKQAWAAERLHQLTDTHPPTTDSKPATSTAHSPPQPTPPPAPKPVRPARSTPPTPPTRPKRKPPVAARNPRRNPASLFFWAALLLFTITCIVTAYATIARNARRVPPAPTAESIPFTEIAAADATGDCETLIDTAMQASEQGCANLGPNQVCYGNFTLNSELASSASAKFSERGDIVDIDSLLKLGASPLNPTTNEWGIAIFKLIANLPRTLPGQNVAFVVFGNTSLTNASGDMGTFYFSSQLGQIACERVPADGIVIDTPEGAGLAFTANGSEITLMGAASLQATAGENMTVSLSQGSASITADGQTQYFGAGQQVDVPLGGDGGLNPVGPPSEPVSMSPEALALACAILGATCDPTDVQPVDAAQARASIDQLARASTLEAATAFALSATATPTNTATATPTITETATPGPSPTPTRTLTPTKTVSHTPSATNTPTITPSPTDTATPTITFTASQTFTPSSTPTATNTPPPTATPTFTFTPSDTPTATNTPTDTATVTQGCAVSAGSLDQTPDAKILSLTVTNQGSTTVTLTSMEVVWDDTPASQRLTTILANDKDIMSGVDNRPNTDLPSEHNWRGPVSNRQIAPSGTMTLLFLFDNDLQAIGYSVSAVFDGTCAVSASR